MAVPAAAVGVVGLKAAVIAGLGRAFGLRWTVGLPAGLLLGPGGEFSFVILALAGSLGLVDPDAAGFALIVAALTMAAIPVGTAIGAAEIIALIGAIITYIMVWVNAMLGMITSMVEMENAAHQAVPGGQWPKAVV